MSVLIDYHWAEPDPDIIAQRIITLSYALEEFIEPMTLAGDVTRRDIRNHFDTQSDPSGRAWDAWADSYEPWAMAHGSGSILNLYGGMKDAATSPGAYVPTSDGLFIDTSGFPEHWAWNNFGAPERQTAGGEDSFGAYEGNANPLPERPFIGLSDAAKAKIDAIFFAWFEGTVAIVMSGRGSKLRDVKSGRFIAV